MTLLTVKTVNFFKCEENLHCTLAQPIVKEELNMTMIQSRENAISLPLTLQNCGIRMILKGNINQSLTVQTVPLKKKVSEILHYTLAQPIVKEELNTTMIRSRENAISVHLTLRRAFSWPIQH